MTIQHLIEKRTESSRIASGSLVNGSILKVMAMAMNSGNEVKEHVTHDPAKLIVLDGTVEYTEEQSHVKVLNKFDEVDIPVNRIHKLYCTQDAVCLLIKYNHNP